MGGGSISPDEGAGRWLGLSPCHPGCGERHRSPNLLGSLALFLFWLWRLHNLLESAIRPLARLIGVGLARSINEPLILLGIIRFVFRFVVGHRLDTVEPQLRRCSRRWNCLWKGSVKGTVKSFVIFSNRAYANGLPEMRSHRGHPNFFG